MAFVHLNVYSDYSVLSGLCKTKKLIAKAQAFGMEAVALTDEGNLFGAVEFYQAAKGAGIKPIIGMETYVLLPGATRTTRNPRELFETLVLLCESDEGYHNLCKLSTMGYLEGHWVKPCITAEALASHSGGLIALSTRESGRVGRAIIEGKMPQAIEGARQYAGIFGKENFFLEISNHGTEQDRQLNEGMLAIARELGLGVVATNQCRYLDADDAEAHDALTCIRDNEKLDNPNRTRLPNDSFYFKDEAAMRAALAEYPEALEATNAIAARCNVQIPLQQNLIPKYEVPEGTTPAEYLRTLVMEGLERRYVPLPPEYVARAEFELSVIEKMRFVDYFLVVWDLIHYARKNGIPVGPGRGSGAGSIVAYALQITNIDPMRYQLLFERFLNPDRISMPDFDIDFCFVKRERMIDYAYEKYGRENVSQIITFGRMLAKNVIRNVGRVMGMGYGEVDRIAKLVPEELNIKLKDAIEKEPELRRLVNEDAQVGKLWRLAEKLEGTINNCGTHAAGVVICDHPLTDHIALFKAENNPTVSTQVEMKCVEEVGLLKMDFLGLRTLTVVHEAVRLVREGKNINIDIDFIEPNDEKTYALLRSGMTTGVFQLESSGMRELARRIGLESLEEMSALVALYRPGPMQFIDQYIRSKFDQDSIVYDHERLEPILKETYGIAVYQEQVMQMVQAVAGFSLGEADILRRAMGKKKADLMAAQRSKFVEGCKANGIGKELAEKLFDNIETFAGYGFNKSHSVAYAYVAYQTAYLKANFPVEFMCAILTSEAGNLERTALYAAECARLGIPVLAPDINASDVYFTVEYNAPASMETGAEGAIRYGLAAIKNVGEEAARAIVAERKANGPYRDVFDLCSRVDTRLANRRLLESLNRAGVFESTGWNRRQVETALDDAVSQGQQTQRDKLAGQSSLFDMEGMEAQEVLHTKPDVVDWPELERLQWERDMLGIYVSSHPLRQYESLFRRFCTTGLTALTTEDRDRTCIVGGMISSVRLFNTSKGDKMAFLLLDTLEGPVEITVFSDLYAEKGAALQQDMPVLFVANVNVRRETAGLVAEKLVPIEEAERHFARAAHIRIRPHDATRERLERVALTLGNMHGDCDVYLHCVQPDGGEVIVHAADACRVKPGRALRYAIEEVLGEDSVWFSLGESLPSHRPPEEPKAAEPRWKKRQASVA
jgi:DNA polymerase-3 subunit alpha